MRRRSSYDGRVRLSPLKVRILIAATGIVLPACASVPVRVPYDVSAPTVIPDGVLGRIDSDGATTIYMEGLDLKIAVQNQRSYERGSRWEFGLLLFPFPMIVPTVVHEARPTENEELSPLVVFLSFDSREEGTLFYPDSVTVDPDDGTVHQWRHSRARRMRRAVASGLDRSRVESSNCRAGRRLASYSSFPCRAHRMSIWIAPLGADPARRTDSTRRAPLHQVQGAQRGLIRCRCAR